MGQNHRAKVIFNAEAGPSDQSGELLLEIVGHLQHAGIISEVYLVHPKTSLKQVAVRAVKRGFDMVIVCGGDGTIESVIGGLVGSPVPLGIIPTGTQNNVARSLGVPINDLRGAVQVIEEAKIQTIDVGFAQSGRFKRYFLEMATMGIVAALYRSSNEIQRGQYGHLVDFLATLVSFPSAEIKVQLSSGDLNIAIDGYLVLVSNLPLFAMQVQLDENVRFDDGYLDLFLFTGLNKVQLMGVAVESILRIPEDPRLQHFRVKDVRIHSTPAMPVLADGFVIGKGDLTVNILPGALRVFSGRGQEGAHQELEEINERYSDG